MTPVAPLIEAFLHETLACQRGVSQHTCNSYAYSFQLLFVFAAERLKVTPSSLTLEQLDSGLVSAFLEYLEDKRKNAPETRNVRLAAIKSFFHFLEYGSLRPWSKSAAYWRFLSRKPAHVWSLISCERSSRRCLIPPIRQLVTVSVIEPCASGRLRRSARIRADGIADRNVDLPSMSVRILGKGRRERTLPLWKPPPQRYALGSLCAGRSRHQRCLSTSGANR